MPGPKIRFLVSISERKQAGGVPAYDFEGAQEDRALNRFPSLTEPRRRVLDAFLASINGHGHASQVLGLKETQLEKAVAMNLAMRDAPLMPVLERFQGPLFSALRDEEWNGGARRRLRERLLVVCPLLGLLAPGDWVPAYRCPVGAQIPGFGSLHGYWKPLITETLGRLCRGQRVFTFLPSRLEALWQPRPASVDFVRVHFQRRKGEGFVHDHAGSGREAGGLIRWMLLEDVREVEAVCEWRSSSGHVFCPERSQLKEGERRLVFVR